LRKVLGEGISGHPYIETVSRRGYRFVADIREVPLGPASTPIIKAVPENTAVKIGNIRNQA
jgi:DNA-binding winged helix-turn-helix (wHTH) protein